MHADFCKTLSHPKRLMILALLGQGEQNVGEIAAAIGIPPANVSQHLTILRSRGLVQTRKEGQTVRYSLSDPRILQACVLIRSVLLDQMKARRITSYNVCYTKLLRASRLMP